MTSKNCRKFEKSPRLPNEGKENLSLMKEGYDRFRLIDHARTGSRRDRWDRLGVKWELMKKKKKRDIASVIRFSKRDNPLRRRRPVSQHGWLIVKPWSNPQRVATRKPASERERKLQTCQEGEREFKITPRNRRVILYNRDSLDIMRATRDDQFVFSGR